MDIINDSGVEMVSLGKLKPHPNNPRRGVLDEIERSIEVNGFYGAVVAQRSTGHILAGNHRYMAAQSQGAQEMPVIWVDVEDEEAKRILLADNRTSDLGGYNEEALASLLQEVNAVQGLDGTGYDEADLDELLGSVGDGNDRPDPEPRIDEAEQLREKWGVERGQIWQVGRHRLMCGDSTSKEDVGRLLDGATPRLMVTDPPYGVEYDPTWRDEAAAQGLFAAARRRRGLVESDDRVDWTEAWELSPAEVAYVWHAAPHASEVQESIQSASFEIRSQIIWAKQRFAISRGHYHWQHEPCWYAVRKGKTGGWIGDRSQTTLWNDIRLNDDVDMKTHGTQKPTECMQRPIRNHEGDVYEPFCGSGTTIVAAEREGRQCWAMEVMPKYVAVSLQRLADMGLVPELLEG